MCEIRQKPIRLSDEIGHRYITRCCHLFDEFYEAIDPDNLDESILRIHQCINEIDNILSEMDVKDPGAFFQISKVLEKAI